MHGHVWAELFANECGWQTIRRKQQIVSLLCTEVQMDGEEELVGVVMERVVEGLAEVGILYLWADFSSGVTQSTSHGTAIHY